MLILSLALYLWPLLLLKDLGLPKFSVVIPAYNAERTLESLLDSLVLQTFRDFDICVVDDCSQDRTVDTATAAGVQLIQMQENSGPAAARNAGAKATSGEWLVFADADTLFFPETLELANHILIQSDADALVGMYSGEPANDGFVPWYKGLWEYAIVDKRLHLDENHMMRISSWAPRPGLVKRSAFEAVQGFSTSFRGADLEDIEFGHRLHHAGYRIYVSPDVRVRHHYPSGIFQEINAFARRVVLFTRMLMRHKQLEAAGEGTSTQILGDMVGALLPFIALCGVVYRPALLLFALGVLLYAFVHKDFIGVCLQKRGAVFALCALCFRWLHIPIICVSVIWGILTWWRWKG